MAIVFSFLKQAEMPPHKERHLRHNLAIDVLIL